MMFLLLACAKTAPVASEMPQDEWLMTSDATDLLERIKAGALTSESLGAATSERITAVDPMVSAYIAVGDATPQADGVLLGLPIAIKDNIDVLGFNTTAGSKALDRTPNEDAPVVARIRAAGGTLVGKTNLSEWANFRSTNAVSGWSSVGGQTRNPHVLDRSPCGSSSGSAVAVATGMAAMALGTETDGSVLCPSAMNGIVGMKPTLGLVSGAGVVPISPSQDTVGPMARSVRDVALLLSVIAELSDQSNARSPRPEGYTTDYPGSLDADLAGLRFGALREIPGFHPPTLALFDQTLDTLESNGATMVDLWEERPDVGALEWKLLVCEFPDALAEMGIDLSEVTAFNRTNHQEVLRWFGQEIFIEAMNTDCSDLAETRQQLHDTMHGWVEGLLATHQIDVLVGPSTDAAWPIDPVLGDHYSAGVSGIAATSGIPSITVPMGVTENLPVGLTLIGPMWSEHQLLKAAFAVEKTLPRRPIPRFLPTIEM